MNKIRRHITFANVMSSLAVFLVLGGATAFAATELAKNSVGSKQLKSNAVTSGKIKKNAVTAAKVKNEAITTAKLKGAAVTGAKLGDGSVTNAKIADGAVASAKLDEAERSQVVSSTTSSSFDLVDTYNPATWTTVMSLNLPNGAWVVQANIGLAIGSAGTVHVGCRLVQGGQVLAQSGTQGENLGLVPSIDGINLAATAITGQVTVVCGDSLDGTTAINRSLIATRTGSITAG